MTKHPKSLEERIADALRESEATGEMQRAKGYGQPLDFGDGYEETPADLRMGYKILKDAGAAPLEVEIMRDIKALEEELARMDAASEEAAIMRKKIAELRLDVAFRLEALAKRSRA
jgi:hypothetical protein